MKKTIVPLLCRWFTPAASFFGRICRLEITIPDQFGTFTRIIWLMASIALLGMVVVIDVLTGYEVELNLLYLLPVLLATWFFGWRLGVAFAAAASLSLLSVRVFTGHSYSHDLFYVMNPLLKFSISALFIFMVHLVRLSLARMAEYARTDGLTGSVNSRHFRKLLQEEIERSRRTGNPFTLAYLDLDNFKSVNDRFGHTVGDNLLVTITTVARSMLRKGDVVARLGGDEFALLLPISEVEYGRTVIAKVHAGLLAAMSTGGWPVTFSIGLLTCQAPPLDAEELITRVDKLMYSVKEGGKNAIIEATCSSTPPQESNQ